MITRDRAIALSRWLTTLLLILLIGGWTLSYRAAIRFGVYGDRDIEFFSSLGALHLYVGQASGYGWTPWYTHLCLESPGQSEAQGSIFYPRWKGLRVFSLVLRNGTLLRGFMLSYWVPCLLMSGVVYAQWRVHWRRMREMRLQGFEVVVEKPTS